MSTIGLLIVTLLSGALAAVMSAIAWRVAREERQSAEARISSLAAEIHAERLETPPPAKEASSGIRPTIGIRAEPPRRYPVPAQRPAARRVAMIDDLPLRDAAVARIAAQEPPRLTAPPSSGGFRFATIATIGMSAFGALAAIAILLSPGPRTAPPGPLPSAASDSIVATVQPLELVALGHERDGERLTVRGVVRNPASGAEIDRLTAVVFVFNREGEFVTSTRAALDASTLHPGHESTFLIAVPNVGDVGRYRVSFRTDEQVVPHVDKRETDAVARVQ